MTSVGNGSLTPSPLTKWGFAEVADGEVLEECVVVSGNLGGDPVELEEVVVVVIVAAEVLLSSLLLAG